MAKLVSNVYGEALFETATQKGNADEILEEIGKIEEILAANPDFERLMEHPGIPKQEKLKIVKEAFDGKVSDELSGFFNILVENERYKDLDSIFGYYTDKMKEKNGIGVAYVTTPQELSIEQQLAVQDKLLKTTGYKTMEMHYVVEKELIGGMVVRIGDRVVDSSIRTKLNDLTRQLLEIRLG